jgi:hypothetical protein
MDPQVEPEPVREPTGLPAENTPTKNEPSNGTATAEVVTATRIDERDVAPVDVADHGAADGAATGGRGGNRGAAASVGVNSAATGTAGTREPDIRPSMRLSKPFVFRSGRFGAGTKVWTIRDAVAHMDRYPEDGMFHLRNNTLIRWLEEEGAYDLAKLARSALAESSNDRRMALEIFLLGTGLVARPQLVVHPRRLDLGYVLAGEAAGKTFTVAKGRGRGYLFGEVRPGEPWLQVHPGEFAGGPATINVWANTDTLSIGAAPEPAEVYLKTNAAEEPLAYAVSVRVMAMPSFLQRFVVRPAFSLLITGLLGIIAGWFLELSGALAVWPLGLGIPDAFSPWMLIAIIWGFCGIIRGVMQPPAWPLRYASLRWLTRVGIWAGVMCLVGVGLSLYWRIAGGTALYSIAPAQAVAWMLVLSILPATFQELRANGEVRASDEEQVRPARRHLLGPILLVVVVVVLLLAAPLGWQSYQRSAAYPSGVQGASSIWDKANAWADDMYTRAELYLAGQ